MQFRYKLHPVRNAAGERQCRWCGGQIPRGRRSWCSAECVNEYQMQAWPMMRRQLVFWRDKGICAQCGVDTEAMRGIFKEIEKGLPYCPPEARLRSVRHLDWADRLGLIRMLESAGWGKVSRSWWEADHILEQVRGGAHALDNLQTLCLPCHKRKTARLAAERAQERKTKEQPELFNK